MVTNSSWCTVRLWFFLHIKINLNLTKTKSRWLFVLKVIVSVYMCGELQLSCIPWGQVKKWHDLLNSDDVFCFILPCFFKQPRLSALFALKWSKIFCTSRPVGCKSWAKPQNDFKSCLIFSASGPTRGSIRWSGGSVTAQWTTR